MRNKKNQKHLAFGEWKTFKEWTKDSRCVVGYQTLVKRLCDYGWELEKALIETKQERDEKYLVGEKFGRLTVKGIINKDKKRQWICECECGKIVNLPTKKLRSGHTKSCGCYRQYYYKNIFSKVAMENSIGHGVAARNHLLRVYKRNAKKRKIEWLLKDEDFFKLTKQNCYYCGKEPKQILKLPNYNGEYIYNGVDRRNSEKFYSIESCVPSCGDCNCMKLDFTEEEFLTHIIKIIKFIEGR